MFGNQVIAALQGSRPFDAIVDTIADVIERLLLVTAQHHLAGVFILLAGVVELRASIAAVDGSVDARAVYVDFDGSNVRRTERDSLDGRSAVVEVREEAALQRLALDFHFQDALRGVVVVLDGDQFAILLGHILAVPGAAATSRASTIVQALKSE